MEIGVTAIPRATRGVSDQKYNKTSGGQTRRGKFNETREARSEAAYLAKEFVGWDGEGINEDDGSHTYCLLANSDGEALSRREGLSTEAVLNMFLDARSGVTHIVYGGGYDINMLLRDVDKDALARLYQLGTCVWNGYRLEWRAGKSFSVRKGKRSFLLYDVLPFFQRSFVAACDEYLGADWEHRDEIIREKANRGTFDYANLGTISEYNRAELSTLVRLADELRERLYKVEIRIRRWDGPGAIATALYQKYNTKPHIDAAPPMVAEAGRHAYAGGRFEIIRKGHSDARSYQYDIRSAYPSAMRNLPCLAHGRWVHTMRPNRIVSYGLYRIETLDTPTETVTRPQPLFQRNHDGTVYFPEYAAGWYWSPEAQLASDGHLITEAWEWLSTCDCKPPFWFVEPLYNERAALKKAGDGAHVGLKLGLNSLYGKLAQQIGWSEGPPLRIPPFHCLEWAGYITSHCRAQVYNASLLAPDDVIAFETDAIFSRVPLDLPLGEGLGEWDETVYTSLTYLKSGMYYGTLLDGRQVEKTRGINRGTIKRTDMVNALQDPTIESLPAEQTRFIGLGQALHQDMNKWRHWITSPRNIRVDLTGKRIDLLMTDDEWAICNDGWSETQPGYADTKFSYPYEVEWVEKTGMGHGGNDMHEIRSLQAHEVIE